MRAVENEGAPPKALGRVVFASSAMLARLPPERRDCVAPSSNTEFPVDMGDVGLHSSTTDLQTLCDFRSPQPSAHQGGHLRIALPKDMESR
jgi:hypothetical protein